MCNLQDNNNQDIMAAVETNKKVYLFNQDSYKSNTDYRKAFEDHLKVRNAHNGAVGFLKYPFRAW